MRRLFSIFALVFLVNQAIAGDVDPTLELEIATQGHAALAALNADLPVAARRHSARAACAALARSPLRRVAQRPTGGGGAASPWKLITQAACPVH